MPVTTNKGYQIQNTGANVGTWGSVLNTDTINLIDKNLGGLLSISLTNANVTLSTTDAQNGIFRLTGTLTGNVIITFPAVGSFYIIENLTTGNFSIVLSNGVGGSVIPSRNTRSFIATDATNGVRFAGQSSLPPGTIIDYAGSTVSASITGSEFLVCDGSAVSRATFAGLFAAIGVLWGAGDGSTTFNVPNLVGRTRAMIDASGSVLSGATTVGTALGAQSITISQANLPAVTLAAPRRLTARIRIQQQPHSIRVVVPLVVVLTGPQTAQLHQVQTEFIATRHQRRWVGLERRFQTLNRRLLSIA